MTYNPKIELLDLGSAIQPVAVVDGFASSPDLWRSRALGEGYDFRGDFYPGQRKHVDHSYFDDVGAQLGAIMRAVFGCKKSLKVDRALYSIVDEHPGRLSLAQRIPHFDDSSDDAYAVVHYLAHDAYGGTAFFRHRTTDLAQITASRHADYLAALRKDFATHGEPKAGYIRGSTEIFDQIASVEFAFNRAVIYHGNQLHCPVVPDEVAHPSDPALGRLTVATFFRAR